MQRMMRRAAIFIDRSVTIIVRFSEQRSKRYAAHIRASLSREHVHGQRISQSRAFTNPLTICAYAALALCSFSVT
jgi:hypothetical protein